MDLETLKQTLFIAGVVGSIFGLYISGIWFSAEWAFEGTFNLTMFLFTILFLVAILVCLYVIMPPHIVRD